MTDPPVPPALGIEGVEWLTVEGAQTATVLVTGRWRRRRPSWSGQPLLVLESGGQRHRFPAIAEPPSLTGTAPGTWRMSFSVPVALAPDPGSRGWLQLGAVVVPLPIDFEHHTPAPAPASGSEPVGEMRVHAAELALRVRQLERELERARAEPAWFAARLGEAELAVRSAEQVAHAERMRRQELQQELDLQRGDLNEVEALRADLAATLERVRELQRAYERQSRLIAEAEQAAAVTLAAREHDDARARAIRAEVELAARSPPALSGASPPPPVSSGAGRLLEAERRAAANRGKRPGVAVEVHDEVEKARAALSEAERKSVEADTRRADAEVRRADAEARRADAEAGRAHAETRRDEAVAALLRSEAARADAHSGRADAHAARADAEARRADSEARRADTEAARAKDIARAAVLEQQLHEHAMRAAMANEAIEELRSELGEIRAALVETDDIDETGDTSAPEQPQQPPHEPAPAQAGPPASGQSGSDASGSGPSEDEPQSHSAQEDRIDAARLEAALERLREAAPALVHQLEAPVSPAALPSPAKPWLRPVLRAMVKRDPAGAGRLVVALLPAQPLVEQQPLAYDLVLSDFGCVAVTTAAGSALVELRDEPRARDQVQLQVRGELATLARLLAAGPVRRTLRRGLARAKGSRRTATSLRALLTTPLSVDQLLAAGVRPEPAATLALIAAMIEPGWTAGERFTVAHREPAAPAAGTCLRVRDGEPAAVGPPPGEVDPSATTIVCAGGSLLAVFGSEGAPEIEIEGDERPVAVLRSWVNRAQSG